MRYLTSAKATKLIGSCGHETSAYIPPNGGRPGPVGQRNIEKAKARKCYDCRVASGRNQGG